MKLHLRCELYTVWLSGQDGWRDQRLRSEEAGSFASGDLAPPPRVGSAQRRAWDLGLVLLWLRDP